MPRPDPKRPREGQESLFESEAVARPGKVLRGRHSAAMDDALDAARARGEHEDLDGGLATVLRAGAWALDSLEAQNRPYGPAKIIDPLVSALREAHMTPDSRPVTTDDTIQELLHELANPTEIPHAAQSE